MTVHVLKLGGCSPAPLASYLKALGILRLVSEQVDAAARGWWGDESFFLSSKLDAVGLSSFFASEYRPSPLVSPWNKGAGFFLADDPGMAPIEGSTAIRFEPLRNGIRACRTLLHDLAGADAAVRAIKDEAKKLPRAQKESLKKDPEYKRRLATADRCFKELKDNLIPRCRLEWRGPLADWFSAAIVVEEDKPIYPALLGTGGNDGRLDFTNNYLQRLRELFQVADGGAPRKGTEDLLKLALFGNAARGLVSDLAVGQFQPGAAGGANAGNGPSASSLLNPLDFVLMMEGTVLFRTALTRRAETNVGAHGVAPFALPAQSAAYASAGESDESARGEQWMPIWSNPLRLAELSHLFAEGRSRLGTKSAREPVQFARAVSSIGVARGVEAFQRFGYIERNGQSNLAVPLGRFRVPERAHPRALLVAELDSWAGTLRRRARDKHAPVRLKVVERRLTDSLFGALAHSDEPARWQAVLVALAEVEAVLVTGSGFRAGPIPRLSPGWVAAADDGSPEFRLALAFSLQGGEVKLGSGIRRHWLPLKPGTSKFETRGDLTHQHLARKSDVVMHGRDGAADAIALVERRYIEGAQAGTHRLPLTAGRGADSQSGDLALIVAGQVDLDRTLALGRALMALDPRAWSRGPVSAHAPSRTRWPDDAWLVLRLATLPWKVDGQDFGCDPAIFRRLAAGDTSGAIEIALRRLRVAGLRCPLRAGITPPGSARLWAAALAFPVSLKTAKRFAKRLDPAASKER